MQTEIVERLNKKKITHHKWVVEQFRRMASYYRENKVRENRVPYYMPLATRMKFEKLAIMTGTNVYELIDGFIEEALNARMSETTRSYLDPASQIEGNVLFEWLEEEDGSE